MSSIKKLFGGEKKESKKSVEINGMPVEVLLAISMALDLEAQELEGRKVLTWKDQKDSLWGIQGRINNLNLRTSFNIRRS